MLQELVQHHLAGQGHFAIATKIGARQDVGDAVGAQLLERLRRSPHFTEVKATFPAGVVRYDRPTDA